MTETLYVFASFDDYFAGTEARAGISGQEYAKLPLETRMAVLEAMRFSFADGGSRRLFASIWKFWSVPAINKLPRVLARKDSHD